MSVDEAKSAELVARLERLPFSKFLPESVRYLLSKGRVAETEQTSASIEKQALGRALAADEVRNVVRVRPELAVPSSLEFFNRRLT